jgi:SulP family sulfate permease
LGVYIQPAFTIALLGAIESLLSAVVADGMIGGKHRSNTELIAQGIANVVTPLAGGIPATGAIARTVTNVKSGGLTPVAGLVHAATLLAIALALGGYARLIPMPCLAGILLVVAYNMSEWRSFAALLRAPAYEVAVLLATFFLTVLVNLTVAIEIGMVLAAFIFMRRMAQLGTVFSLSVPRAAGRAREGENMEDHAGLPPGVDMFEISGPFFFAAAQQYQQVLMQLGADSRVVVIRMRHVPFIDATGLRLFREAIAFMQTSRRTVFLSGVRPSVLQDLRRFGVADLIGKEHIFSTFEGAMAHIRAHAESLTGRSGRHEPPGDGVVS